MNDFHNHRTIKATRRQHRCEQCQQIIVAGAPAYYGAGRYDGEFYSFHIHTECHEAAKDYAKLHDLHGEDWPWFAQEHEPEAEQWMRDEHPLVADRLGWKIGQPSRPAQRQDDLFNASGVAR